LIKKLLNAENVKFLSENEEITQDYDVGVVMDLKL
jgi:hypothetical protein